MFWCSTWPWRSPPGCRQIKKKFFSGKQICGKKILGKQILGKKKFVEKNLSGKKKIPTGSQDVRKRKKGFFLGANQRSSGHICASSKWSTDIRFAGNSTAKHHFSPAFMNFKYFSIEPQIQHKHTSHICLVFRNWTASK